MTKPEPTPLPEPSGSRTRYRSEPGMIGHYPWAYDEHRKRPPPGQHHEREDLFTADQMRAHAAARDAAWQAAIDAQPDRSMCPHEAAVNDWRLHNGQQEPAPSLPAAPACETHLDQIDAERVARDWLMAMVPSDNSRVFWALETRSFDPHDGRVHLLRSREKPVAAALIVRDGLNRSQLLRWTAQPRTYTQAELDAAVVPERAAGGALVFWRQWIALQLQHNLDKMVRLSIKNFHFPGLNYVCFDFTPEHTMRLYIVEPAAQLQTKEVNIHNHLYDSQILCLHGSILNTTYKLDNDRDDFNIYALTSALAPGNAEKRIKLEFITRRGLSVDRRILLAPGDTHFQPHTEIHNVENDPQTLTAFMVFEFPTVKKNSRIFPRKNYGDTIPTPGAYQRFEREELRALVSSLLEDMKRSND